MMRDLLTQYGAVTIPLSILFAPLLRDSIRHWRTRALLREMREHPDPESEE